MLDRLVLLWWRALLLWLHQIVLLCHFLSYVEGPVLSPVHSGCWIAAGTTGSGTCSITRSSCLQAGHREYLNQDLTSCKRMSARGGVSSCWQRLQRKTRCLFMAVPPRWPVARGPGGPRHLAQGGSPGPPRYPAGKSSAADGAAARP